MDWGKFEGIPGTVPRGDGCMVWFVCVCKVHLSAGARRCQLRLCVMVRFFSC